MKFGLEDFFCSCTNPKRFSVRAGSVLLFPLEVPSLSHLFHARMAREELYSCEHISWCSIIGIVCNWLSVLLTTLLQGMGLKI